MELKRIDHVALDVTDRDAAIAFYRDVLGMPAGDVPEQPGEPVFVGDDQAKVALFADPQREIRHFAFETDRAGYDELLARLTEQKIEHRRFTHQTSDSIYFADPSGNRIEVLVPI